jgi:anaerobic magnesium-protoporphyrin IX monomethyl ester cyclase
MKPAVVVLAPNSFRRFLDPAVESQFQLHLSDGHLASCKNLDLVFNAPLGPPRLDDGFLETNPMAGYYLESFLKQNDFEATAVFNWRDDWELERALQRDPVAIAFSTTYVTDNGLLTECVHSLRSVVGGLPVIVGGPYIWKQNLEFQRDNMDLIHQREMREFGVDPLADCLFGRAAPAALRGVIFVVSEFGEHTLLRVLNQLLAGKATEDDLCSVPNLAFARSDGSWCFTPAQAEPVDLENDYTRWDTIESMPAMVPLRASVGCPYRCRYCDFIELHPRVLRRSSNSIAAEIELAKARSARVFGFVDDNIFLSKKRIADLARTMIERELNVAWGGFFRVDRIDEENISNLAESGCVYGLCGIETGDEGQLARMRKDCRNDEAMRGIQLATEAGMVLNLCMLAGFPGETAESIENSIGFLNSLALGHKGFASWLLYPFYLLPGTAADSLEFRREHGIHGRRSEWRHATMSVEEVSDRWAPYMFGQIQLPYHYYTSDVPRWWPVNRRNRTFELRKALTQAFVDELGDGEIQTRFGELWQFMAEGSEAGRAPSWARVLAARSRQPGRRRSYRGAFEQ